MLVAARSLALSPAASVALARSRRRLGLAVTCACVVRHCACVLAPPMGAITSGGLHVIGRTAPDQLGLSLPDRVGVVRKLLTVCLCGFCPGRLV